MEPVRSLYGGIASTPPSTGEPYGFAFVGAVRKYRHLGTSRPERPGTSTVKSEFGTRLTWGMNRRSDQFL